MARGTTPNSVATRRASLPAVGETVAFWDFTVGNDGYFFTSAGADSRVDQQLQNQPLPDMRYLSPSSCTLNHAPANCSGTLALPGTGIVIYAGWRRPPSWAYR